MRRLLPVAAARAAPPAHRLVLLLLRGAQDRAGVRAPDRPLSVQHILNRARERYGLVLPAAAVGVILRMIGLGAATRAPGVYVKPGCEAWLVEVEGKEVLAITWRRDNGQYVLRTVLPAHLAQKTGFTLGLVLKPRPRHD